MSVDFSPYHAVLLDLDGTIYHEDRILPGAIELVRRLQREGKPFACLSNSASSPLRVMARLEDMGIDLDPNNIYTAAAAACDFAIQHFPVQTDAAGKTTRDESRKPRLYNLATESVDDMLHGLVDWVRLPTETCDAILVGPPGGKFDGEERRRHALELTRRGAAVIGLCADRVFPSPRGIEFGAGSLSWMLAYAANVEPIFCGKPEAIFFQELCARLNVDPAWCLLIGDNFESDVGGGKSVGMRTILTLGGVTRRSDLESVGEELQPDLVVEDLTELL
jgi:HAD superfamily hydrolase (TIGR01450 family)